MGQMLRLSAADGHTLDAYRASPQREAAGAVVVIQEVFGLTSHMLGVVRRYAEAGFDAIAPAMFDRIEHGLVFDYSDVESGRAAMRKLEWPAVLADVQAAADMLDDKGSVAVVGFCWGGTVAHVAASDLPIAASVSYYGTGVAKMLDKRPRCPIMYHFGDQDASIPAESRERIREANPDAVYHLYAGADHGFDCRDRASFNPEAAAVAFERTVGFLREHLSHYS